MFGNLWFLGWAGHYAGRHCHEDWLSLGLYSPECDRAGPRVRQVPWWWRLFLVPAGCGRLWQCWGALSGVRCPVHGEETGSRNPTTSGSWRWFWPRIGPDPCIFPWNERRRIEKKGVITVENTLRPNSILNFDWKKNLVFVKHAQSWWLQRCPRTSYQRSGKKKNWRRAEQLLW